MPITPIDADQIALNANSPQSGTIDGQSASQHSLSDQIKAAQMAAAAGGTSGSNGYGGRKSPWRAAVTARAIPPGAVGGTTQEVT